MYPQRLTTKLNWIAKLAVASEILLGISYFSAVSAYAETEKPSLKVGAPCAWVESSNGEAQVLDRTRTQLVEVDKGVPVTCGGWVNVLSGWVKIKHRNGYRIQLAAATFVNFPDKEDHLVVYKGQIYASAGGGTGEMRILTANARARVSRGSVIVTFNHAQDDSQLITLENTATLENRFAEGERIIVKAGEASDLNVSLNRVVPSIPAAVAVAQLQPKMMALHLADNEQSDAVARATARRERKFASSPTGDRAPASAKGKLARKIAGRVSDISQYTRHQRQPIDRKLASHMASKLVGGENIGTEILFPDRYYGKTQRLHIEVEDPNDLMGIQKNKKTDAEKQRLMRELSQIRIDQ